MTHMYMLFLKTNRFKTVPASKGDQETLKLNHGEFNKYNLSPSKIDMAHVYILLYTIPLYTMGSSASTTYAELPMVELDEVAEGVREPPNQVVSRLDCFKSICHWK